MMNSIRSVKYADRFPWMAIISSLVLPAICLDYMFTGSKLVHFTVPYGQYIFFITTVLAAGMLLFRIKLNTQLYIFSTKMMWIFVSLFLVGFFLSSPTIWGLRLLSIIALSSLAIVIVAIFVHQNEQRWQPIFGLLFVLPFAFPVFSAFCLEMTGPLELGLLLKNYKHMGYSPPRWYFLYSSANGFGFSAAFVTVALYVAFFTSSKASLKIMYCMVGLIACYALICSGTRAAYIFALASIFAFHLFYFGWRQFLCFFGALLLSFLILVVVVGPDEISSFLRLDSSNLQTISSGRWNAIRRMWEILSSSPIYGLGFGAASNNFPFYPSNIFYFALPLEVGVIGFIGAMGILGLPVFYIIKQMLFQKRMAVLTSKPYLSVLSVCVLAGFVPYLMFEFNVLRVSAVNQLFFFCWAMATLEFGQKHYLN